MNPRSWTRGYTIGKQS